MANRSICSIAGCGKVSELKRGWCPKHYRRWLKYGSPTGGGKSRALAGESLAWLVSKSTYQGDDCIQWPYARTSSGYGHVRYNGFETSAHRVMCILANGEPSSPELDAAHSCNNRSCCSPKHLRWATKIQNQADRVNDGTAALGQKNPMVKIDEGAVRTIRGLRGVMQQQQIADMFGITKSNVSCIQLKKSWSHLL